MGPHAAQIINDEKKLETPSRSIPPLYPKTKMTGASSSPSTPSTGGGDSIKVAVRVRPFLPFESGNVSVVKCLGDQIEIAPPAGVTISKNKFTFDATYDSESTQAQVYVKSIVPLVDSCLEGYNATIIAYGQTGSGKTHSILGQTDGTNFEIDPKEDMSEAGVIPRALRSLFQHLDQAESSYSTSESKHHRYEYGVKVQFIELYGEDIRDLLQSSENPPKLSIRDGRRGVEPEVLGINTVCVKSAEEALLCLTRGTLRRVTRATKMNSESSRSHAIMTVIIEQKLTTLSEEGKDSKELTTKQSKLHFVDLAGSERIKKTGATGQGLKEGVNINKGLLVLGNVISALASQGKSEGFVPYRDSKLTRLLKGSLGGNHKTLMIACVSPSGSNTEESLNTLRYANRAKNIQNKAVVNMDAGSKMIAELRGQLKAMAIELLRVRSLVGSDVVIDEPDSIFTESVLKALAGGSEVDLKIDASAMKSKPKKSSTSSARPTTTESGTTPNTRPATGSTAVATSVNDGNTEATSSTAVDKESNEKLEESLKEIKRLKRALEKSDDRVIETERQLEWVREELKVTKDEVNAALADNIGKSSGSDEDSCSASGVSALTEDFEMPRLSQETYETVKSIYEEKLIQMTLELKEREDERENIAMTLYRHESDSQRLFYVKNTLTEDLARKEEQINELKQELRDICQLNVIPDAAPSTERQFRRLRARGGSKRMAANATMSMSSYYTEKLNKIEKHIKLREEECANLGSELEKLEADSQIFTDLAKDLSDRLKLKDQSMNKSQPELKEMTQQQLSRLNVVIEKDREEREQLEAELKRLQDDSETFTSLVKALTDERKTKLEHVEKYKRRHRELAQSIGMPSPYGDSGSGDDIDDDASVSSTWSFMSIDSQTTSGTGMSSTAGNITKLEYDTRVSTLEASITKHEEDRIFILNDLEKLEADTHAFNELSSSLKLKLQSKGEQIDKLRTDLEDFTERLKKQEKELEVLTNEENGKKLGEGDLDEFPSAQPVALQ